MTGLRRRDNLRDVIQLLSFPKHAVPPIIAAQIRSFVRIQWPFLNGRGNRIWDYPPRDGGPTTLVLVDDEMLISHTEVNFRDIDFVGETLKVGGISAVFTYPAFRGSGHANKIVTHATDLIRRSDADLAMLFTAAKNENFYTRCGWCAMKNAHVLYGEKENPTLKDDNVVMMLFVSPRGERMKNLLETQEIYVGATTW